VSNVSATTKNAVVAGAAGGVGDATCRELVRRGWRVFAGVHSEAAAEQLDRAEGRIVPVVFDVTDEASLAAVAKQVDRELGASGLDGLVNAVGIVVRGPLELVPLSALRRQFEVNVFGQVAVVQAFLPALRRGRGRLVNVGAASGRVTIPFLGAISASKTALESVTDALRMELKHFGIAVSLVDPSHLYTEIFAKADAAAVRDGYAGTPPVHELYGPALEATEAAIAKQRRNPVDKAVKPIVKALTARRPKTRYLAGRDARLLEIVRHLPDGVRDRMLMSSLGLKKDLFVSPMTLRETEPSAVGRAAQRR
jgi:NAD(P)-dependent dehydrogenase (short-subunit alcohol dehydrogenase family)